MDGGEVMQTLADDCVSNVTTKHDPGLAQSHRSVKLRNSSSFGAHVRNDTRMVGVKRVIVA